MKLTLVIPIVAAMGGFGLGWLAKPAGDGTPATPPAVATLPGKVTAKPDPAARPSRGESAPPARVSSVREPASEGASAGAAEPAGNVSAGKNAAKMLRLAEAVGLSDAQQADLKKLIAESQKAFIASHPAPSAGVNETLDHFAASGAALEKGLAALLTPEQSRAFEDLRKRERDNRIETTAQRELGNLTEVTDLTAEQRDKVLALLRTSSAAEAGAIPPSLALILDSSVLPLGSDAPSAQSIENLSQLAAALAPGDPAAPHAKLIENQRRELDERLNRLKDVLTPAQVAQYRAAIAEQHAIQDTMMPPQR